MEVVLEAEAAAFVVDAEDVGVVAVATTAKPKNVFLFLSCWTRNNTELYYDNVCFGFLNILKLIFCTLKKDPMPIAIFHLIKRSSKSNKIYIK